MPIKMLACDKLALCLNCAVLIAVSLEANSNFQQNNAANRFQLLRERSTTVKCSRYDQTELNCETELSDIVNYVDKFTSTDVASISDLFHIIDNNLKSHIEIKNFSEIQKVFSIIEKLQELLRKSDKLDSDMLKDLRVVNILSKLINTTKSVLNLDSNEQTSFVQSLYYNLRNFSTILGCNIKNSAIRSYHLKTENIELNVSLFYPNNQPLYYYQSSDEPFNVMEIESEVNQLSNLLKNCDLPIVYASFVKLLDTFFNDNDSDYRVNNENFRTNSKIFMIDVPTEQSMTKNTELNVALRFNHTEVLEFGDKSHCVYWEFATNQWSNTGCKLIAEQSSRDVSQCACDQLSNIYALFIDTTKRERRSTFDAIFIVDLLLTMIISVPILLVVSAIIIYKKYKHLWKKPEENPKFNLKSIRETVIINVCVCLLFIDIIVAAQFYRKSPQRHKNSAFERSIKCDTISTLLLIFLLSTLFWLCNLAYLAFMYGKCIDDPCDASGDDTDAAANPDTSIKFLRFELPYLYVSVLLGYLIPILIAIPAFFVHYFQDVEYKNATEDYFCGVSMNSHFIILLVVFGLALLVIGIMGVLTYRQFNPDKRKIEKSRCFILIGLQLLSWLIEWLAYLLYIHQLAMGLIYMFLIFNAAQAISIVIFMMITRGKSGNNTDNINGAELY